MGEAHFPIYLAGSELLFFTPHSGDHLRKNEGVRTMNEYETLAAYVVFSLLVFAGAVVWNKVRKTAKKRFNLLNYRSKDDSHPEGPLALR